MNQEDVIDEQNRGNARIISHSIEYKDTPRQPNERIKNMKDTPELLPSWEIRSVPKETRDAYKRYAFDNGMTLAEAFTDIAKKLKLLKKR